MKNPKKYEIKAEILQGIWLPEDHGYQVEILIGEKLLSSDKAIYKSNGYNIWNKILGPDACMFPYQSIDDFPDVFIYLV